MQEKLAPGIHIYNNKIDEYYDVIEKNMKFFFEDGRIISKNTESYVDLNSRKVKVFSFSKTSVCHEDDPINILKRNIENITKNAIDDYKKIYSMDDLDKNHEWEILKYDTGSFFKTHIDDCAAHSRTVSVVIYFNENYSGGEIEFPNFNITYKPKTGDILIFPSIFVYSHSINEITSGTRYAAVNWFSYAKTGF